MSVSLSFNKGFAPYSNDLQTAQDTPSGIYAHLGKRSLDILFALALIPILLPLVGLLALLVHRDGGPSFFGHRRIGRNGQSFTCWKLRSMVPDAKKRLQDHLDANPADKKIWLEHYKLPNDPRVTQLGRFLRKTSLDELPQFFNVLIGDMSVVGPRPVTEEELGQYGQHTGLVFSTRPGITGLWQVSGRSDISYDERVQLDLSYVGNLSFMTDTIIIARTIGEVLRRTGI